jgi:SHS2 domain-containing protein
MYETFDHTADLGLRIRAADLSTLLAEAGHALTSVLIEDLDAIRPDQSITIRLPSEEPELLFFDWLRELLYQFDVHHFVFSRFTVTLTECGLEATARGEPLCPERHIPLHEIKAITYHGLRVERTSDGWLAEVIVDI